MFREKFEGLSINEEDASNNMGFNIEDLAYLISPQATFSPTKKKQKPTFSFDGYGEPEAEAIDEPVQYLAGSRENSATMKLTTEDMATFNNALDELLMFDDNQPETDQPAPFEHPNCNYNTGSSSSAHRPPPPHNNSSGGGWHPHSFSHHSLTGGDYRSHNDSFVSDSSHFESNHPNQSHNASLNSLSMFKLSQDPEQEQQDFSMDTDVALVGDSMKSLDWGKLEEDLNLPKSSPYKPNQLLEKLPTLFAEYVKHDNNPIQTRQQQHNLTQKHSDPSLPVTPPKPPDSGKKPQKNSLSVNPSDMKTNNDEYLSVDTFSSGVFPDLDNGLVLDQIGNFDTRPPKLEVKRERKPKPPLSNSKKNVKSGKSSNDEEKKDDSGRTGKSLASISRRFVEHFGEPDTIPYISGKLLVDTIPLGCTSTDPYNDGTYPSNSYRVDGAADALGVHVRRIYELIKILEILSLVSFSEDERGRFSWKGCHDFLMTLGTMQDDAVRRFPEAAKTHLLPQMNHSEPFLPSRGPPFPQAINTDLGFSFDGTASTLYSGSSFPSTPDQSYSTGDWPNEVDSPLPVSSSSEAAESPIPFRSKKTNLYPEEYMGRSNNSSNQATPRAYQLHSERDTANRHSGLTADEVASVVSAVTQNGSGGRRGPNQRSMKKRNKILSAAMKKGSESEEFFVAEGICKSFLQLFLIGLSSFSMTFAIQCLVPFTEGQTLNEYNKRNATKIRRVYDVANVLCSLNLIEKKTLQKERPLSLDSKKDAKLEDVMNNGEIYQSGSLDSRLAAYPTDGGKLDGKILEWCSFNPVVIRNYYLEKSQK